MLFDPVIIQPLEKSSVKENIAVGFTRVPFPAEQACPDGFGLI
jgi:hypothetical protein